MWVEWARSGQTTWKFEQFEVSDVGMLTTATDVFFTGAREGSFVALDARTGAVLWKLNLGAPIVMAPITFQVDGKQYVSVIDGHTRMALGLRD
jgi:glucose dehydrogenase